MNGASIKVVVLFLLLPFLSFGQENEDMERNKLIEQSVDFLLESNEDGNNDYTSLFEQLEYYYEKPLNLNTASREDLIDLGIFNEIQIGNLLQHIKQNGKLISFEELQSIDGFDLDFLLQMQYFCRVNGDLDQPRLNLKSIRSEGSSQLFIRHTRTLENQEGYSPISADELVKNPNARYLGSPDKIFARYRFNYANNISFGITGEKDQGEEFFKNTQKNGFDFYSAHLFLQDFGKIKQLALGDYQAQFGQGLTFWSGLAFGRTPNIFTLKRNAPGLRRYTSVQEDLFLRGAGISLNFKNIDVTIFHSDHKVDANIQGFDSLANEQIVSSLITGGFHRTPSELENKNVLENINSGANVKYSNANFSIGITAVRNEIKGQYAPDLKIYNQFSTISNENSNVGVDYNYVLRNFNFFGEISKSIEGGIAYTNGAILVLDPRLSLAIQHRKFDRNFIPIQSNAIGESSTATNEEGFFAGINFKPQKQFTVSAYVDQFNFDWLRYQTDAPSQGLRYLAQIDYQPSKQLAIYFRYRKRSKEKNQASGDQSINQILREDLNNYRLNFSYQVSKSIKIKNRLEWSNYKLGSGNTSTGFLIYQDINYKLLSFPVSLSLRYAIFDVDSYNSRIYAYENDVLYSFSVPAYSGKGSRFYINIKYHVARGIDLWLRYAQTYYENTSSIGTGKESILGNTKSEIKTQIRFKF